MSNATRRVRLLSREALGVRVAGAMMVGLGAMAAFGCTAATVEADNPSQQEVQAVDQASQGQVQPPATAFEYADGSDMYGHKSALVTDAALIGEGAQFVNGLDVENTYIYKGFAHSDRAHYSMYSLYTELITDGQGKLTAINLTSGNDTWSNKWGAAGSRPTITGTLPEGVAFDAQTSQEGANTVITPQLTVEAGSEAEAAGHAVNAVYLYNVADDLTTVGQDVEGRRGTTHNEYDASIQPEVTIVTAEAEEDDDDDHEAAASGRDGASEKAAGAGSSERGGQSGERSGSGERGESSERGGSDKAAGAESSERGGKGDAAAEAAASEAPAAEADGTIDTDTYAYDGKTGAITVKDGAYNLVQVVYQVGTEVFFNQFIPVGDSSNGQKYVEANFPETDLSTTQTIADTARTNRTKWTYSMLSLMAQRELVSWGLTFEDPSLYTGGISSEIGDIDTISGATKTSVPFQDALNQAVAAGYVTGVADEVAVTIDGGASANEGIDVSAVQQDQTVVTKNADGTYQVTVNFPAGIDELAQGGEVNHAISPTQVDLYALGDQDLGALGVWNLGKGTAGFTPVATYADSSSEAGDVSDGFITYVSDWDYPYNPTFTVNDPSITHVVVTFAIGHESLGIAYDLEAMAAANEVTEAIEALDASDSNAVQAARDAYDALTSDVKGTVGNYSKLLEAEGK